jgi:putative phosphoesterase
MTLLMRIGLVSDTHIPEAGAEIPAQVYQAFRGVDLILHAGDMHIIDVLDWLENVAPVLGARGNGDYPTASNKNRPGVPDDPRVKEAQVLQLEGLRVGLIHAFPLPEEILWRSTEDLIDFHFKEPVDVIVCGDTHMARIDRYPGLLMINSGSPTLPNQISGLGTVAFLEIHGRDAEPSILQLV